jgi:hypothetical protein
LPFFLPGLRSAAAGAGSAASAAAVPLLAGACCSLAAAGGAAFCSAAAATGACAATTLSAAAGAAASAVAAVSPGRGCRQLVVRAVTDARECTELRQHGPAGLTGRQLKRSAGHSPMSAMFGSVNLGSDLGGAVLREMRTIRNNKAQISLVTAKVSAFRQAKGETFRPAFAVL